MSLSLCSFDGALLAPEKRILGLAFSRAKDFNVANDGLSFLASQVAFHGLTILVWKRSTCVALPLDVVFHSTPPEPHVLFCQLDLARFVELSNGFFVCGERGRRFESGVKDSQNRLAIA